MPPYDPTAPTLEQIEGARRRLEGLAVRTPLVEYQGVASHPIHLKLENLQPIRSFKLRGAGNALRLADPKDLAAGVTTASAGNMAQGVAYVARELGISCRVVVPDHAPRAKLKAVERLGGVVQEVPFADWWQIMETGRVAGAQGFFLHPVCDSAVIAGNATIGLEILDDLEGVETVLVPFGGGGLSCGIAAAVKARRPNVRVLACEVETAAPLSKALAAREVCAVDYRPSFVDGIGGRAVLEPMWPLVQELLDGAVVVSLEETAEAMRLLIRHNCVVAEGAGAVPLAAALSGRAGEGPVVCVVSGGNIDAATLSRVLDGEL
jgi:threonine dehydratase